MDAYNRTALAPRKIASEKCRCYRCHGTGQSACQVCGGSGTVMTGADPNGHPHFKRCEGCLGRRASRCPTCHGQLFI